MGNGGPFLGVQRPRRQVNSSPPFFTKLKNVWSCTSSASACRRGTKGEHIYCIFHLQNYGPHSLVKSVFTPRLLDYKIREAVDKSLARPTSRCHRTESIVSLERGVRSCAELQVISCYRGWKEACQATRAISTTSRRELSSSFFFSCKTRRRSKFRPFWKKHYVNMHHRLPPSKTVWLSLNVVIFPPVLPLVVSLVLCG